MRDVTPIKVVDMEAQKNKELSKVPSEKKYEVAAGDDSGGNNS